MRTEIVVGDTLNFLTTTTGYPASAGWVLTYKLIPKTVGPAVISIPSTPEGDDHRVIVTAAVTAAWVAGEYSFEAYVTKALERYRVESGQVRIAVNPATATSLDNRSHERKVLEAIEAVIENRASQTQREMIEYTIGSRSQKFDAIESKAELLKLHSKYKWLVANEEARAAIAAGQPNPRNVRIRFGRP